MKRDIAKIENIAVNALKTEARKYGSSILKRLNVLTIIKAIYGCKVGRI